MIFDTINQLNHYSIPSKEKIISFLKNNDPRHLSDGEHSIDGKDLFVKVMSYVPKPALEKEFETHRVYADLQYVVTGVELMQTVPSTELKPNTEYDPVGDYQFFKAEHFINDHVVRAGQFMVFFPGEAHRPSCLYQNHTASVKKLVFKIRIP